MESRTVSPVFIGRGPERAALADVLARADAGRPQAVLVGGEAGVGKTRLLEEFLADARRAGATTALGACVEAGADGLPFAPVATLLRFLNRALGAELSRATAGSGGELARLLPELAVPGEAVPAIPATGEQEARTRLFDLIAGLLESLAQDRLIVLAIEDLHWSDRSTRELIGYLVRSLRQGRLLLAMTYRSDDLHRRHPLRPFLAELDRLPTVRRVDLARFTRDEVRGQLAAIRGAEPTREQLDQVFRRSEGNAFFVEELATAPDHAPGALSESVRDLLLLRVEGLPAAARRVVAVAAAGGSRVEHGLLRAVTGLTDDELIEALRAAVGAHVLRAGHDETYTFRHALLREAVDDDLLPGERTRLSRRFAEALEADPSLVHPDELVARRAVYWYCAKDPARALPAVLDAARGAHLRYAYAEQLGLLTRALELWDDAPPQTRRDLTFAEEAEAYPLCQCPNDDLAFLDLLAETVLTARNAGEPERGLPVVRTALRVLDGLARPHPLRAAWFLSEQSKLLRNSGRGTGADELAAAQELLTGMPPTRVHAKVLAESAGWCSVFDARPENVAVAERAVALAREVGDRELELGARLCLGGLLTQSGRGDEGLPLFLAVIADATREGVVNLYSRTHLNYQSNLESVGRSQDALAVTEEGLSLVRRHGLGDGRAWLLGNHSDSLFSLGRWAEAETAADESRCAARTPVSTALAAQRLARIALARGDVDTARALVGEMQKQHNAYGWAPQYAHPLLQFRIELAAADGLVLDARSILAAAYADLGATGSGSHSWPLVAAAAVTESQFLGVPVAAPGRAEAIALVRAFAAALRCDYPVWQAYAALVEAELLRAEGRASAADWAAVAAAFDGLTRPWEAARVAARWGEALLAEGDREGAAPLLAEAFGAARELGAAPLVAELERLAHRARLPVAPEPSAPRREPAGLTPREREVLTLVAAGRSNRQIAEELFISPKTASVHVSNILAKLEVSGRGEAAAVAHRLGLVATAEPIVPVH
ncbi:helix-turn-helix transcriptional regulator [Streptomyces sp. RFCAC02]|uniref:helix-turn-helix transcriptional regulator n=1 Tax=Streptomyces sp. RFCAC02 TaxID=2499143 RepID=UPI0010200B93|nr:helix-turn-helix transcriptional regulator [Streptomyces sp. RFCAC02]